MGRNVLGKGEVQRAALRGHGSADGNKAGVSGPVKAKNKP